MHTYARMPQTQPSLCDLSACSCVSHYSRVSTHMRHSKLQPESLMQDWGALDCRKTRYRGSSPVSLHTHSYARVWCVSYLNSRLFTSTLRSVHLNHDMPIFSVFCRLCCLLDSCHILFHFLIKQWAQILESFHCLHFFSTHTEECWELVGLLIPMACSYYIWYATIEFASSTCTSLCAITEPDNLIDSFYCRKCVKRIVLIHHNSFGYLED